MEPVAKKPQKGVVENYIYTTTYEAPRNVDSGLR